MERANPEANIWTTTFLRFRAAVAFGVLVLIVGLAAVIARGATGAVITRGSRSADPAVTTLYSVARPRGLMVTTGGWAYCLQVQALARRSGYTLLCGRYAKDGYLGYGLRSQRHLDWGDPAYLSSFTAKIEAEHRRVGGKLVLIGVSYSGFGVATLASHHPEMRPDRLIVIDSFLDLVARRQNLPATHETAREIDAETGGSLAALRQRSVDINGLARLVRTGTQLTVIWSTSADEQHEFAGATCDKTADAGVLEQLATTLGQPVSGWVTQSRHGHDLWDRGRAIIAGRTPGVEVVFRPGKPIPAKSVCG
jgi:pimeloyl-ACP methyl ester carboxylesterase